MAKEAAAEAEAQRQREGDRSLALLQAAAQDKVTVTLHGLN